MNWVDDYLDRAAQLRAKAKSESDLKRQAELESLARDYSRIASQARWPDLPPIAFEERNGI
jgi:hypothetical protein